MFEFDVVKRKFCFSLNFKSLNTTFAEIYENLEILKTDFFGLDIKFKHNIADKHFSNLLAMYAFENFDFDNRVEKIQYVPDLSNNQLYLAIKTKQDCSFEQLCKDFYLYFIKLEKLENFDIRVANLDNFQEGDVIEYKPIDYSKYELELETRKRLGFRTFNLLKALEYLNKGERVCKVNNTNRFFIKKDDEVVSKNCASNKYELPNYDTILEENINPFDNTAYCLFDDVNMNLDSMIFEVSGEKVIALENFYKFNQRIYDEIDRQFSIDSIKLKRIFEKFGGLE